MSLKHVCTLANADENFISLNSTDLKGMKRICWYWQELRMVSEKNRSCGFYFRSNAAVQQEKKRHIQSKNLHIIHPFSVFRIYWEMWMMLVFGLVLFFSPLEVAMNFIVGKVTMWLNYTATFFDLLCLIDIVLTFFTGYAISSTKEVILEPKRIMKYCAVIAENVVTLQHVASLVRLRGATTTIDHTLTVTHYVFTYFIFDVVSSIPYRMLSYEHILDQENILLQVLPCMVLIKIVRIWTWVDYFNSTMEKFHTNFIIRFILYVSLYTCLLLHWTACLNLILPNFVGFFTGSMNPNSWIILYNISALETTQEVYVTCIFRASCYLLNFSFGVIDPQTTEDLSLGIISFITGKILIILFFVKILQLVLSAAHSRTKYEEIMNEVQQYLRYKQLPLAMQKRLLSYYQYRFQNSYFRENLIATVLSGRLREEIKVCRSRRLIDSVYIFKNLPQHIISDVVNKLNAEFFLPNDTIIKAGSIGDCMYFIAHGTVAVYTPTGKEVCHLQDGAHFGEISLLTKDLKRTASVVAIEICQVYRLSRVHFKKCFSSNSDLFRKLEDIAGERRIKTRVMEDMYKKYLIELEEKLNK